ncbi:hypothetical protein FACS189442_3760 [Spirochaetia bacterium]|nr:hypothetical protein FACS189442_3760 [Spirochaetia bacterium]
MKKSIIKTVSGIILLAAILAGCPGNGAGNSNNNNNNNGNGNNGDGETTTDKTTLANVNITTAPVYSRIGYVWEDPWADLSAAIATAKATAATATHTAFVPGTTKITIKLGADALAVISAADLNEILATGSKVILESGKIRGITGVTTLTVAMRNVMMNNGLVDPANGTSVNYEVPTTDHRRLDGQDVYVVKVSNNVESAVEDILKPTINLAGSKISLNLDKQIVADFSEMSPAGGGRGGQ